MSEQLIDPIMLELFRTEIESHTGVLNDGLLALEADPQSSQDIKGLMRAAHSIKGAARIVGLECMVGLAHAMEDTFVALQNGSLILDPDRIDALLKGVDLLAAIAQLEPADMIGWLDDQAQQISGLENDLSQRQQDATPTPKPSPESTPERSSGLAPVQTAASPDAAPSIQADPVLLDLFHDEVKTQTGIISAGIEVIESGSWNVAQAEALVQATHALKNATQLLDLAAGAKLAAAMQAVFEVIRNGGPKPAELQIAALTLGNELLKELSLLDADQINHWGTRYQAELKGMDQTLNPASAPAAQWTASQVPAVAAESPTNTGTDTGTDTGTGKPEASQTTTQGVVRVDAASLNRLLGLAGQSLVDSRRLEPFATALMRLKHTQGELAIDLNQLQEGLDGTELSQENEIRLQAVLEKAGACRRLLTERLEELEDFSRRTEQLSDRLYHEVVASRMRPFADGLRGFPRLVRDVSRQLGKRAQLEISGQNTPVDRDVLEKLEAPLNHIIRNALDHGLEPPQERLAAGKSESGKILLEARHRAGMLSITIADDGRGINLEVVRRKVVERGLADPAMADQLSETELIDFLLLPGFSTAEKVTDISGRGVGLDVVQSALQEIGGSLQVAARTGGGTQFHLQSPLTLSVVRTLLAQIAGRPFAFPLTRIDRVIRLSRSEIHTIEDRQHFMLDEQSIGLVTAHQLL
jgi:two-component system sensor histidine kinase and response regulator WspE